MLTQLKHVGLSVPGHIKEVSGLLSMSDRLSTNQSCGHKMSWSRYVLQQLRWFTGKQRQNYTNPLGLDNINIKKFICKSLQMILNHTFLWEIKLASAESPFVRVLKSPKSLLEPLVLPENCAAQGDSHWP